MITQLHRAKLETEFMQLCRDRGPDWIASVIRPLRLQSGSVTVQNIPAEPLGMIVRLFGRTKNPPFGVVII